MASTQVLYKFRDWDNPYHRRILSNNELFFANNEAWNDPYDFRLPLLDVNPFEDREWAKRRYYEACGKRLSVEDLDKAESEFQRDPQNLPEELRELDRKKNDEYRDYERHLGIFCGSILNTNPLMWGHYANSHKGFCVGLDFRKLKDFISNDFPNGKSIIEKVNYEKEMPYPKSLDNEKFIKYLNSRMITKSKDWEYENEYRIILVNSNNKQLPIDSEIYKEIIFGLRMDPVSKFEIKAICKEKFPHIEFYTAQINNKKFMVEIIPEK